MQNIDPKEITKFERSASHWWDKQGEFKPLHDINPLRLAFITQHLDLQNQKVIDVGCGGGILAEAMARQGAEVLGIDMSESALAQARSHAKVSAINLTYQLNTVEAVAKISPEAFDVITCMELLEHVPDPASIVQACANLAKPGGYLFFSTINRNLKSYILAILGAEYLLKLLPKNTHDYANFIKPSELAKWGRTAGLTLKHMAGISYNPLTKQYQQTASVDVNYLVSFVK